MKRRAGGFTLTEVVIAVLLSGLVLGIAIALVRHAALGLDRGGARVTPRQAGLLAMTKLRDVLADAAEVTPDADGAVVVLHGDRAPDDRERCRLGFDRARGEVYLERGDRRRERLVAATVAGFRIWTEPERPELVFLRLEIPRPPSGGPMPLPLPPVVVHHEVRLAARDGGGFL